MHDSRTIADVADLQREATDQGGRLLRRREEPWASGQRKRYLASLDAADEGN
jgi:hypothetical protein